MVDLTIEDQSRLKVIYGSAEGFHAVDLDSAEVYDIYLPKHVSDNTIYLLDKLIYNYIFPFITDSGCNHSALYCGASKLKWYATTAVL